MPVNEEAVTKYYRISVFEFVSLFMKNEMNSRSFMLTKRNRKSIFFPDLTH